MLPTTIDRHLGCFLQSHDLTDAQFAVLNRILWTLRSRGSESTQVTLDTIMRRTGKCRATVVGAIRRGCELGIIRKIRQKIRRAINGRVRVVNWINIYVFGEPPDAIVTESKNQTTLLKERLDSSLLIAARAGAQEEAGNEGEFVQEAASLASPAACEENAPGNGGEAGCDPPGGQGRPEADSVGGGLPGQHGGHPETIARPPRAIGEAGEGPTPDRGQAPPSSPRPGGGGGTDLLIARRKSFAVSLAARTSRPYGNDRRQLPATAHEKLAPPEGVTPVAQTESDRRIAALERAIIDTVLKSPCRGPEGMTALVRATVRVVLSSAPSMGIPAPVLAERLALICHAYLDSLTVPPP